MPRKKHRHWGTGEVKRAVNGTWRIRWREGGRKRFKSGFASEDVAKRVLAKIKGDLAQELAGLPPDPRGFPPLSTHVEGWLERRKHTHYASYKDDKGRWTNHLEPHFGKMRPAEVEHVHLRRFAEEKLRTGMNPGTLRLCMAELSTLFSDLCERPKESGISVHPVKSASKTLRALWKSTHDPKTTPFLERIVDIERLFSILPEPFNVAFAVGALEGLRTGEVLAVDWPHLDLERQRHVVEWQVAEGELRPLKDREARIVPIPDSLLPVLKAYHLKTGGKGLLFPPAHPGRRAGKLRRPARFMREQTLNEKLREGLAALELPVALTWYQCTRHTFASHFVREGGSLEKLAAILGHSSTEVTKRYAHLRPDHFAPEDMSRVTVDLSPRGRVLPLGKRGKDAHKMGTITEGMGSSGRNKTQRSR